MERSHLLTLKPLSFAGMAAFGVVHHVFEGLSITMRPEIEWQDALASCGIWSIFRLWCLQPKTHVFMPPRLFSPDSGVPVFFQI